MMKTAPVQRQFKGLSLSERQQLRHDKLLEAGLELYGEHGFFSVTVKDICQHAKLTERYFYESFKNNTDLFKSVYLALIDDLQQRIVSAVLQVAPKPEDMIRTGLSELLHRLHNEKGLARILFIDAVLVQEVYGSAVVEANARFEQVIAEFMALIVAQHPLPHRQLALIASGLNGYVAYVVIRWVLGQFTVPFDEILQVCMMVYQGILEQMKTLDKTSTA